MKRILLLFILFSLPLYAGDGDLSAGNASADKKLSKGESFTFETEYPLGDVAVTDREVVDFLIPEERNAIYLHAKGEGNAVVTLWDKDGDLRDTFTVTVYGATLGSLLEEAEREFRPLKSVRFLLLDGRLQMAGEAPSPADFRRLNAFAARHPEVQNDIRMAPAVLKTMTSKIAGAIAMPGVRVRSVRNSILLEGVVYSEAAAKKALTIATLYYPDTLNLIEVKEGGRHVGREKMVRIDLYFMEIQKSALKRFGIEWAPGAFPKEGGEGIGGLSKSVIGFVLNLLPKIRMAKERGLGRVLENPSLFVKSGDRATFFSGVEVPYYSRDKVEFKEVGITLEAWPIVSGKDVDLKITASVSTPSAHIEGGVNRNKVDTTAYIPLGQAVVLGGIMSHRDIKTYNRIPRDLDTSTALFTLFKSKDFLANKTELVLFALPQTVDPGENALGKMEDFKTMEKEILKEKAMQEYKELLKKRKRKGKK